jgi:hypothetical protein
MIVMEVFTMPVVTTPPVPFAAQPLEIEKGTEVRNLVTNVWL